MDFLKAVLGDRYEEFVNLIKGYNEKPENKDKQVKLIDLNKGEYVSKAKYDEADTARNTLRSQLDEAEETLRGFEGVDVKQLQTDLADLTTKMGTQKEEYENQIAQMKFDAILDAAITKSNQSAFGYSELNGKQRPDCRRAGSSQCMQGRKCLHVRRR